MNKKEEQEFLKSYDLFSDALFRYCYFRIGDREQAKDMVSDIFLKTWEYIHQGNQITNTRAFLYRLAHNMVIDWYRKKKSSSLDTLLDDGYEPVDSTVDVLQNSEFQQILSQVKTLSEEDQDLILLRYVEDVPIKEIADLLHIRENVVSVRLHRAIARLKSKFK